MSQYRSKLDVQLMNLSFCGDDDGVSFCGTFLSLADAPNPHCYHSLLPQELDLPPAIYSSSSLNDKDRFPSEKAPARNQFRQ